MLMLESLFETREPGERWGTTAGFFVHALILTLVAASVTLLRWLLHPGDVHIATGFVFWGLALAMHGLALVLYPGHND